MKIAVIGTGYIGLVSGVCFAKIGHSVICVDKDSEKISKLKSGEVTIYEPGLADLLSEVDGLSRLQFSTDVLAATRESDVVFIAVGTPTSDDGLSADLRFVFAAAEEIAVAINTFKVIVIKSTVPAGTSKRISEAILRVNPAAKFEVASNPEFLREGAAIFDFMNPDRIVLGAQSTLGMERMRQVYSPLTSRGVPVIETSLESAELIKFASNGVLATKIAFINEMAELCEKIGADVQVVARGMGLDERIGPKFLAAGPGFGGSCLPKDTRALLALGRSNAVEMDVIGAVIDSNENTKRRMVEKIRRAAGGSLKNQKVVVFGVTFKADTDDMRDAPSLSIVPPLIDEALEVRVVDPEGKKHGEALFPGVKWYADVYGAVQGTDLIVVLTEWKEFKLLDLGVLARSMRSARIADLRNIYSSDDLSAAGFIRVMQVGRV